MRTSEIIKSTKDIKLIETDGKSYGILSVRYVDPTYRAGETFLILERTATTVMCVGPNGRVFLAHSALFLSGW